MSEVLLYTIMGLVSMGILFLFFQVWFAIFAAMSFVGQVEHENKIQYNRIKALQKKEEEERKARERALQEEWKGVPPTAITRARKPW